MLIVANSVSQNHYDCLVHVSLVARLKIANTLKSEEFCQPARNVSQKACCEMYRNWAPALFRQGQEPVVQARGELTLP